jgi:amidase
MMTLLTGCSDLDPREIAMLLSLQGQLAVCQIVDPLKTARMEFPRELLERIGRRLP